MRWTVINAWFHNKAIRISYLIVIGLPIVLEVLVALKVFTKMPDSIYLLFYSGVGLIGSYLIYTVFVPQEIRNYLDIHDYENKLKPALLVSHPNHKKEIVMVHLDESQSQERQQIEMLNKTIETEIDGIKKQNLRAQLDAKIDPLFPGCVTRFLHKEWFRSNTKKNWAALYFCFIINIGATGLTLWVFFERIKTVIDYNRIT